MNSMNGLIGGSNVNVQDAAELGTDMLRSFYNDMPSDFYDSIRERVTTMETARTELRLAMKPCSTWRTCTGKCSSSAINATSICVECSHSKWHHTHCHCSTSFLVWKLSVMTNSCSDVKRLMSGNMVKYTLMMSTAHC